jgi:predicted TIM-barrel fold metal-dependent hydrolase
VDATVSNLESMLGKLKIARAVVVQPSFYGTDNSCLVNALTVLGNRARGIAVVDDDCSGSKIDNLHTRGVRGLRINAVSESRFNLDDLRRTLAHTAKHCLRNGWHIQIYISPALMDALFSDLVTSPVPLVIDHFGLIPPTAANVNSSTRALLRLLDTGNVSVKLSAPYRITKTSDDADLAALVKALSQYQEAILWGSDWPHTPQHSGAPLAGGDEIPYRDIDTGGLFQLVGRWFPDARSRQYLLVTNPARLYGW